MGYLVERLIHACPRSDTLLTYLTPVVLITENVEDIHKLIGGIQGPRTYLARITTEHTITEYWNCVIHGHQQQGIDVFELDDQGRVVSQTVWLRPGPWSPSCATPP